MLFETSNGISTTRGQDFIWAAEYFDESNLLEFENDSIENSFYAINKQQLSKFGLIGCGHKMFFDVLTGVFNVSGKIIELEYINENNVVYKLTNNGNIYNDIIQFKDAEANFNPADKYGSLDSSITKFNFGYKQKLIINDLILSLKVICRVPYDSPVYLEISLTSNEEMNGKLIIKRDGKIIDTINAPIKDGIKGTLNWDII